MNSYSDPAYRAGNAFVCLSKYAAESEPSYEMHGRLFVSESGWLLMSVPVGLVRGAFEALNEQGLELPPPSEGKDRVCPHVSVCRAEEVASIGGPDKITERGKSIPFRIVGFDSVEPAGWKDISRVWFFRVASPALKRLRASYGLSPEPKHPFHITVAVRKRHVLRDNDVKKAAGFLEVAAAVPALCVYEDARKFAQEYDQEPDWEEFDKDSIMKLF